MSTLKKMSKSGLVKTVFCLLGLFTVAAASTGCEPKPNPQDSVYVWVDPVTGDIYLW